MQTHPAAAEHACVGVSRVGVPRAYLGDGAGHQMWASILAGPERLRCHVKALITSCHVVQEAREAHVLGATSAIFVLGALW